MDRIQLTPNFYLDEFTLSETAERHGIPIVVHPGSDVFNNLKRLCAIVLQPVRDAFGPVTVISGYRPASVNKLVGGKKTSFHVLGLAADFIVAGYTPLEICQWIKHNIPNYDQLIHEYGRWTHAGIAAVNQPPRHETFTAIKIANGLKKQTRYIPGILPLDEAFRRAA